MYAYSLGTGSTVDTSRPVYCISDLTLPDGQKISVTYYLDRKDGNGDLLLSKGFVRSIGEDQNTIIAELVYNNEKVWPGPNGTLVDGMEDAACESPSGESNCGVAKKTKFYTSNLYRGFYLRELPGFDLAYETPGGEVKIYRMRNFTGNKEGKIDPAAIGREW